MSNKNKKRKILFLGRENCKYTQKAYQLLVDLNFDVTKVISSERNKSIPKELSIWRGDYILSFRSFYYLSKVILSRASQAAINFHPGSHKYPGTGCINFALYNNDDNYGVTAHIMDELIDHGQIISQITFPISASDNLDTLLKKTHINLFHLFKYLVNNIKLNGLKGINKNIAKIKKSNISWVGKAKKVSDLNKLQIINKNASKQEIERIIRATYTQKYPPMIRLHNYKFIYKKDE